MYVFELLKGPRDTKHTLGLILYNFENYFYFY